LDAVSTKKNTVQTEINRI